VVDASTVVIDGQRIAFISCVIASEAVMVVNSNVIVNQGFAIQSSGALNVGYLRIMSFDVAISSASSMYAFGSLKWNNQGDTTETWDAIADTSEMWTPITAQSESWAPISDTSETWAPVADTAEVWETV
jgi:hypothetical protein